MSATTDNRRFAPAVQRNQNPILSVLREVLPSTGPVLEVASGTGEHVVHFARHMPDLEWYPSDPSAASRESIAAWIGAERLANVRAPLELDATQSTWPVEHMSAIICINMLHISPWEATAGLMVAAGQILSRGGVLFIYGPFRRQGRSLEPSNEAFDQDLRTRDPRWGLRELDRVIQCGEDQGLVFERFVEMPANNLSVIFRRA